ncbi:MAG: hypothetical protein ACR5LD_08615 [Symbiopectobacterium sp.]
MLNNYFIITTTVFVVIISAIFQLHQYTLPALRVISSGNATLPCGSHHAGTAWRLPPITAHRSPLY